MANNGVLSQEEIDALLNSDQSDNSETNAEPAAAAAGQAAAPSEAAAVKDLNELLNEMERDAIGEVGNISMGSAATALSTLLNSRVEITAPKVDVTTYGQLRSQYPLPFLVVDVSYTQGLKGANILVIRHQDASIIADLMMGNDGSNPPAELSDFHLGALGEAMNQMMGSSCTAMSSVLEQRIEIGIPAVRTVNLASEPLAQGCDESEPIVRINFQMQIGDLINSEIMQVVPLEFSRQLLGDLMKSMEGTGKSEPAEPAATPEIPAPAAIPQVPPSISVPVEAQAAPQASFAPPSNGFQTQGGGYIPPQGMYPPPSSPGNAQPQKVQVQPAQFATLQTGTLIPEAGNIGMIMDVPLQITVELGKTRKTIREILTLGPGSVLELDKLAGEPVDLLVNGKLVAKGEVVVIDENFGVRVTDIISPIERVANLQ